MKSVAFTLTFIFFLAFGVVAPAETGCKNLPPVTPVTNTLGPLGLCVIQTAATDIVEVISDPAALIGAVVEACSSYGKATVDQIVVWIEEALGAQPALPTTAASVSASVAKSRLSKVHAAALAMQHIVITPVPAASH